MHKETKLRSIIKAISWRIFATLTTVALVYLFIGDTEIAFTVGGIEVFLKMLIYFIHERLWDKLKFGKHEIKPFVVWITGLARSGKSEIGEVLYKRIKDKGLKVEHLDGHTLRELFPQIGYQRNEVNEHIERVGYLSSKLESQGIFVVATFLSPYSESREFVKKLCNNFIEIYISTSAEYCEKIDDKGIYVKAKQGLIENFPGVSSEYEIPKNPTLTIDTEKVTRNEAAEIIFNHLKKYI
ncbi:MAG: adenylyl-sulfate kinase [Melioribacteraceae bacterium]